MLYVGLTRAENWLIICSAGKLGKTGNPWYRLVENGMENSGAERTDDGLILQNQFWSNDLSAPEKSKEVAKTATPIWLNEIAPAAAARFKTLSPSDLGGAKALPSESNFLDEDTAKLRGTLIHNLLEHLPNKPQSEWQSLADTLLQDHTTVDTQEIYETATRVLTTPELQPVFTLNALTEVKICAIVPELNGETVYGDIDRLIVNGNHIIAVDYKSNRTVPDNINSVPDGLLRQMGAYLLALKQIYPRHTIDIAILWTETQNLMSLPHELGIDAAKSYSTS